MIVTFLGTGTSQGVPVIACDCEVCQSMDYRDARTRTSVHIALDDLSLIIDTGPDFRHQVLRERIKRLDAVIFTHEHKDHTAGLDEVRSFNFKQGMDMPIYGEKRVLKQLQQEFEYIFSENKYPGVPRVDSHEINSETFSINGQDILPIRVLHYKLPVLGFRINGFTYITDANQISKEEKDKVIGSEVLVINALQKESHISHFNLEEALELISELKPKRAFLTHISHKLGFHEDINSKLPENVYLAYDGMKIHI